MAKRDPNRTKRQLKIDFSSEAAKKRFQDMADEWGVSYSQLAELLLEFGTDRILYGDLNLGDYLRKSKLPWIRTYDIDIDKFRQDIKKKGR